MKAAINYPQSRNNVVFLGARRSRNETAAQTESGQHFCLINFWDEYRNTKQQSDADTDTDADTRHRDTAIQRHGYTSVWQYGWAFSLLSGQLIYAIQFAFGRQTAGKWSPWISSAANSEYKCRPAVDLLPPPPSPAPAPLLLFFSDQKLNDKVFPARPWLETQSLFGVWPKGARAKSLRSPD